MKQITKNSPNILGEDQKLVNKDYWIVPRNSEKQIIFNDLKEMEIKIDPKQISKDLIYLEMAEVWSKNSHCKRKKVGSLIVNKKSIIADGYNGTPSGFPNDCEDLNDTTYSSVLHAEANAITKLARSTQSSEGSTLYVTLSPCYECAKLIIQSGIKRVVFRELYRNTESLDLLILGGVELVRIK